MTLRGTAAVSLRRAVGAARIRAMGLRLRRYATERDIQRADAAYWRSRALDAETEARRLAELLATVLATEPQPGAAAPEGPVRLSPELRK